MTIRILSYERLHGLFEEKDGVLRWKATKGARALAGQVAGCDAGRGYRVVRIDKRGYLVHRVVWVMNGGDPTVTQIDHINTDKGDNRFSNLRAATGSQNQHNRGRYQNNTSGYKGVGRYRGRWRARISIHGQSLALGVFDSAVEAAAAYQAAALKHHGEFARF